MVAIATYDALSGCESLGRKPLITYFLCGAQDQESSLGVRASLTGSLVASTALVSGVSLQDFKNVAGWFSLLTFVRFLFGSEPDVQVLLC